MIERLTQQLRTWFAGLDPAARTRLYGGIALTVAVLIGTAWLTTRTNWQPLFQVPLPEGKLLDAAAALDEQAIGWKLENNNLYVDSSNLGKAKGALNAKEYAPELGQTQDFPLGASPRVQEYAMMRAREQTLVRAINEIDGISASAVNLVASEEPLYLGERRPASASVLLTLEPGVSLSESQVRGIASLVANAVENLDPDRVSIIDGQGRVLAEGRAKPPTDPGDPHFLQDYRRGVEEDTENAVVQALAPMFGTPAAFTVTAAVDVDLTSKEVTSRQLDITKQATISEVTDESTDQRNSPQGIPGVDSNLPERTGGATTTPGQSSNKASATVNYVYPTVDEKTHVTAGKILRKSIAVQIDQSKLGQIGGGDAAAAKSQIEAAVRAAIGFDEARNDQVVVTVVPFAPPEVLQAEAPTLAVTEVALSSAPYAVALAALAMVFLFIVRPMMAVATGTAKPASAVADAPVDVPPEEHDKDADLGERLRTMVESFNPVAADDLNRLVDRESVQAAAVLRKWTARR